MAIKQTYVEKVRRSRILISIYAYAYEFENDCIILDTTFDEMCKTLDFETETGNELLDNFFKNEFDPNTGVWIHKHPELGKVKHLYERYHEL